MHVWAQHSVPKDTSEWLEVLRLRIFGLKNYIILKLSIHLPSTIRWDLVGGFNPFRKISVKLDHVPNFRGEHWKYNKFETTTWRCFVSRFLNNYLPPIFLEPCWDSAKLSPSVQNPAHNIFKNPTRQAGSFYGSHSSNMFAFLEPDTPLKFDHLKRIFILQPSFFRLNVKLQDTSGVYLAQQNHVCHLQTNQAMCTSAWLQVLKHV